MSDTALAIAAGLLGGLNRGMEQRRQRKREEKQDERADKALQIQRDYYLLAKDKNDREIAALEREIAAAQKYGYGSVEELETERKYLMAENERIQQDAMLFEKEHRDELLALEKRERETRIAASQESILSSRESRANASEERQYRRHVQKLGESSQNFEVIAKQLTDILRTHPVSAEVEGQIRDALASGDPAQAQAALQKFTRKAPGDLFSPLQASHMASEKERREGVESGQRQSAIQHLGAMERMFSSAVDDAVASQADSEEIENLRQQLTVIRAALADPQLTDPMAQRILDNIEARNKTSEVPGVEQETKTPGSFFMRPLDEQIRETALDMRNDPDLASGLGSAAKLGIAVSPIPLSLKSGQKVYDFLNDEYKDFMGDPTGYPRRSPAAKVGMSVFGLQHTDLGKEIADVMTDPERRQNLLDSITSQFEIPSSFQEWQQNSILNDPDAVSNLTLRSLLFGYALPKSYGAVSGAARGAMAAQKPSPALPGNSQPGQLPAPSQVPLLGHENVIHAGPPAGQSVGFSGWEYPFKGPSTFAPAPVGQAPLALPAPAPQGSVIPMPSRFPAQGVPPVPSNIDLESILQALSRDWGHRGGAMF